MYIENQEPSWIFRLMTKLITMLNCHFRTIQKFFFTVEARIEQINSAIGALQKQIKSQFKVALLQQSRATRQLKVEDFYYKGKNDLLYAAIDVE